MSAGSDMSSTGLGAVAEQELDALLAEAEAEADAGPCEEQDFAFASLESQLRSPHMAACRTRPSANRRPALHPARTGATSLWRGPAAATRTDHAGSLLLSPVAGFLPAAGRTPPSTRHSFGPAEAIRGITGPPAAQQEQQSAAAAGYASALQHASHAGLRFSAAHGTRRLPPRPRRCAQRMPEQATVSRWRAWSS